MDEGTGSSRNQQWWIGIVGKLFKGKAQYQGSVSLNGELPKDMFVVCEWYSRVPKSQNLKFQFRQITDRAKYSFLNCIGIIRIDL